MSPTAQVLSVFFSVLFSFMWVSIPGLNKYSLQLTAILVLGYFFLKWKAKKDYVHILPKTLTLELSILVSAVLLLIGSTGGTNSIFVPGLYVLLFFSLLTTDVATVTSLDLLITLFLWSTTPPPVSAQQISTLLSFPVILPIIVFGKLNYDKIKYEEQKEAFEEEEIMLFLSTFLKPKMQQLANLSQFFKNNQQLILKQIELVEEEIDAFISKAKSLMER